MKTDKQVKYTIITPEILSVNNFLVNLNNIFSEFKGENLILDFSGNSTIKTEDLNLFLNLNTKHKNNGTSFVVVCKIIDIDSVPDELSVTPTINEAEDIIEMEIIERELGF